MTSLQTASVTEMTPLNAKPHGEPEKEPSHPNRYALTLIFLCVFVGDMARGILFPTLWLFVQQMGGNRMHQGVVVAAFSFGRIISSPMLGSFSEERGYLPVLVLSNSIIATGCLGYALANTIPLLVAAQVVIGFGSGTLGVTRSYIAENFSRRDRSEFMAYLTATQYAGFTVTPIFGSVVSYLGFRYPVTTKMMYIDEFSVPALFMGLLAALLAVAFLSFDAVTTAYLQRRVEFSVPRGSKAKEEVVPQAASSSNNSTSYQTVPSPDMPYEEQQTRAEAAEMRNALILGGFAMNIFTKGTIGVFETLGSEFATDLVALSSSSTGYVFSALGACGALTLVYFSQLVKHHDEVRLTISGIYLMILSCVMMSVTPLAVTMDDLGEHAVYSPLVTCWFLLAVSAMYATGYPVGHTALLCLFSKIQKSGPQGKLLGWFGFSGSLARVVFPLSAGLIAEFSGGGDSVVFLLLGGVLCVALCLVVRWQDVIHKQCAV